MFSRVNGGSEIDRRGIYHSILFWTCCFSSNYSLDNLYSEVEVSKLTIFTACDDGYFIFLEGMLESIKDRKKEGIKRVTSLRVVVFDTGLLPKQVKKISKFSEVIDIKNMDLREFYGDALKLAGVENGGASRSILLSLAIRPFLPKWAGDSDILMWMDSDAWLQDSDGVEQMVWAANLNTVAVVPETGRLVIYAAYRGDRVRIADLFTYFDIDITSPIINLPMLNAGVYAARVDSPLWRVWENNIKEALIRTDGIFRFGLDQVSFNYAIYKDNLKFTPLPFECDYCASLTTLVVIEGKICSSAVPFEQVHTVHMTSSNKWIDQLVIVLDREGNEIDRIMTKIDYLTMRKLRA